MIRVHGSCVALDGTGVLLRGPSGSGKSDLALRLIDAGAALVSDDQTELRVAGGRLTARAPDSIAGRIEVRGIGILPVAGTSDVPLGLVVDLASLESQERMPAPAAASYLGLSVPCVSLWAFAASAAAKVRLAVRAANDGILPLP